jgi:hypothetical protein
MGPKYSSGLPANPVLRSASQSNELPDLGVAHIMYDFIGFSKINSQLITISRICALNLI